MLQSCKISTIFFLFWAIRKLKILQNLEFWKCALFTTLISTCLFFLCSLKYKILELKFCTLIVYINDYIQTFFYFFWNFIFDLSKIKWGLARASFWVSASLVPTAFWSYLGVVSSLLCKRHVAVALLNADTSLLCLQRSCHRSMRLKGQGPVSDLDVLNHCTAIWGAFNAIQSYQSGEKLYRSNSRCISLLQIITVTFQQFASYCSKLSSKNTYTYSSKHRQSLA